MSISSVGGASQVSASSTQSIVMAKKALDQQKQEGQSAVQLIEAAAPPPVRQGHSLSVYA